MIYLDHIAYMFIPHIPSGAGYWLIYVQYGSCTLQSLDYAVENPDVLDKHFQELADIASKNNSAMGYHHRSIALLQWNEKCAQVLYLVLFYGRNQRDE